MKFEHKYPGANSVERFEFEYSFVTKSPKLGSCRWCNSFTRWIDVLFQMPVCSEECCGAMWRQYKEDQKKNSTYENFESHFDKVKSELLVAEKVEPVWKDIIIVVHDQLDYFKACVESLQATTKNYHLYVWDNASKPDTMQYTLDLVMQSCKTEDWKITVHRSKENVGFIGPNNEMAAMGTSPYIILLNSDTKVFEHWDTAMIGHIQQNPDVGQVGYWGGHMGPDGRGFGGSNGYEVDYIPGWCFCIERETYDKLGLFNPQLKFAYCEDADLSLRLKEAGKRIYALHAPLVHHYQNKTIVEVEKEGEVDVRSSFDENHMYLKTRWANYLLNDRVLLKSRRESRETALAEAPSNPDGTAAVLSAIQN